MAVRGMSLHEMYAPIQADLDRLEALLDEELASGHPFVHQLLRHAAQFQGKRIRPAFLMTAARACGGVQNVHVALSAVIEVLHCATLAHDDVLDEASMRRQVPTLNARWGNEAAIMLGDYLFATSFELCARLHIREANLALSRAIQETCTGEMAQISSKFNFNLTEAQYLEIIGRKTGALFATACRLGCVGHDPGPEWDDAFYRFGMDVGSAFQVADDCLDLTGDEARVGKSLGTDLEKGKITLPLIRLLTMLPLAAGQSLKEDLAASDGIGERRGRIRTLVQEHDTLNYAFSRAHDLVERAKSHLRPLALAPEVQEPLFALADYAVARDR